MFVIKIIKMNTIPENKMLESEEVGERNFNFNLRNNGDDDDDDFLNYLSEEVNSILESNYERQTAENCIEEIHEDEINAVDNMLFSFDDENNVKTNKDELVQDIFLEDTFFIEQVNSEMTSGNELLDNYNKLVYQGEEYYVKKKNYGFPIYVMNAKMTNVGVIRENDINNIEMI